MAKSEAPPAPRPEPMKLRRAARPHGRPRSEHLRIERHQVCCLSCLVVVERAPDAVQLEVVHRSNCTVFAPAKEAQEAA